MFTITIKDTTYSFNFNIGFMKEMNKVHKQDAIDTWGEDARKNSGLLYALMAIYVDDDVEELINVLLAANNAFEPKVSEKALIEYLDDENTDIDEVLELVKKSLLTSNSCKKEAKKLENLLKKIEEAQKAEEEAEKKAKK